MNIIQQLTTTSAKFGRNNKKLYITIHETGNFNKGANAKMHANLQSRGFSESWHWTVDDTSAYQSFTHDYQLYHAGDGAGNGGLNSIGIEICVNSDGNYLQAIRNAAELVKKIMKDENISIMKVVQHNHWSGKNCPQHLRAGDWGINWNGFINLVKGATVGSGAGSQVSKPTGKKIKVGTQAKQWQTGSDIPKFVIGGTYDVLQEKAVNQSRSKKAYLIGKGKVATGWLLEQDVDGFNVPSAAKPQATGDSIIKGIQANVGITQDGWDGPNTRKGTIRLFQRGVGTPDDGIVGNNTLNKAPVIRSGSQGWHVYAVQAMLYLKGYKSVGKPDKIWGANSIQACKNFQKDNRLGVDGTPGRNTYAKLMK